MFLFFQKWRKIRREKRGKFKSIYNYIWHEFREILFSHVYFCFIYIFSYWFFSNANVIFMSHSHFLLLIFMFMCVCIYIGHLPDSPVGIFNPLGSSMDGIHKHLGHKKWTIFKYLSNEGLVLWKWSFGI